MKTLRFEGVEVTAAMSFPEPHATAITLGLCEWWSLGRRPASRLGDVDGPLPGLPLDAGDVIGVHASQVRRSGVRWPGSLRDPSGSGRWMITDRSFRCGERVVECAPGRLVGVAEVDDVIPILGLGDGLDRIDRAVARGFVWWSPHVPGAAHMSVRPRVDPTIPTDRCSSALDALQWGWPRPGGWLIRFGRRYRFPVPSPADGRGGVWELSEEDVYLAHYMNAQEA